MIIRETLGELRARTGEVFGKAGILKAALKELPGYLLGDPRSIHELNVMDEEIRRDTDALPGDTRTRIEKRLGRRL